MKTKMKIIKSILISCLVLALSFSLFACGKKAEQKMIKVDKALDDFVSRIEVNEEGLSPLETVK